MSSLPILALPLCVIETLFCSAAKRRHLEKLFLCPWQNILDFTEQVNTKSKCVMSVVVAG